MNPFNSPTLFRHVMNLWPPFLGAGIRVRFISRDWRKIVTQLRLYGLNRNYMGTHFGGSLFSMTDPFYMLITDFRGEISYKDFYPFILLNQVKKP
jgi:hypothetical protein